MTRRDERQTAPKTGRKPLHPTAAQRRTVATLAACGLGVRAIAHLGGMAVNTLRKHFRAELSNSREIARGINLMRLEKAAGRGNVTAMRELAARIDRAEILEQPPAPRPEKRGKREVTRAEAMAAGQGSEWGDVLTPLPTTVRN